MFWGDFDFWGAAGFGVFLGVCGFSGVLGVCWVLWVSCGFGVLREFCGFPWGFSCGGFAVCLAGCVFSSLACFLVGC